LSLTPTAASLVTGASQQFSVSGTWSDGTGAAPSVTYAATGGAISASGLYVAGSSAGSFQVIATHASSGRADTSAVTVTAPPATLVNECVAPRAGWIWCDDFDSDRMASYFEVDNSSGGFTRVNGVGNGNSWGMRARWTAAGQVSAGSLHLAFGKTPQTYFKPIDAGSAVYRELYWRVYVRNQPGWVGGGGDKLTRAIIFASPTTWANAAKAPVWSGSGADSNYLSVDPVSGTNTAGVLVSTDYNDFANQRYLGQKRGVTPLFDAAHVGQWYCVEAHAVLNQPGQSNGVLEFWINDTLEARNEGMNWVGSYSAYGFNALFLENYWNAGTPVAQERYLDNFVVSTQRIRC
jgi:hypothetical protein